MIKFICNYLKECFCNHEYELISNTEEFETDDSLRPYEVRKVYMCKKCG